MSTTTLTKKLKKTVVKKEVKSHSLLNAFNKERTSSWDFDKNKALNRSQSWGR